MSYYTYSYSIQNVYSQDCTSTYIVKFKPVSTNTPEPTVPPIPEFSIILRKDINVLL